MTRRRTISLALVVGATALVATATAFAVTSVKPYAEAVGDEYTVQPLFSVNNDVPVLGGVPGTRYRMVGIPDGLGAMPNGNGRSTLYMNHELGFTVQWEPYVGGTKKRGAFVSKWILDVGGNPTAGKRAYDTVYLDDTLVGPAATASNMTPGFRDSAPRRSRAQRKASTAPSTSPMKRAAGRRPSTARAGSRLRSST